MRTEERRSLKKLTFYGSCPFECGEELKSPVMDGNLMKWTFAGRAFVDQIECVESGWQKTYTVTAMHVYQIPATTHP